MTSRSRRAVALNIALIAHAALALGYEVNCDGNIVATDISSTFGEARLPNGSPSTGAPTRFHVGTDVHDCAATQTVKPIEAGTIIYPVRFECDVI